MLSKAVFGIPADQWEAGKKEARNILVEVARKGRTIFYSQLVQQLRSISLEAHDPRLFHMLGEISSEEDGDGRGMLTALVIHKGDGQPGQGFFELAASLGRDVTDKDLCWATECRKVHDFWHS